MQSWKGIYNIYQMARCLSFNCAQNFFYLTKIESKLSLQSDGEEVIYFCKPDGLTGKNWKPITPPNSRVDSANQHATAIQERQFLVAQLDLFAKLCKVGCAPFLDVLTEIVLSGKQQKSNRDY